MHDKNGRLELRISRQDQLMQSKYIDLQNNVYNIETSNTQNLSLCYDKFNDKLNIITKDMESLLNNDKLLLDKLIEKNIVSTIQEHNEELQNEPQHHNEYL